MVFRAPGESPTPRSLRSRDRLDRLDRRCRAVCSPCNRPYEERVCAALQAGEKEEASN